MYTGLSYNRCWIKLPIHKKSLLLPKRKIRFIPMKMCENNLNKHAKILTIYELK